MSDKVPFDKVVLSCDENPIFVPFASLVAKAWGKFFPEVQVELAFVTKNLEDSRYKDMMNALQSFHPNLKVTFFPTVDGVNSNNLGKVARLILASRQGESVCLIHDMDTVPLQRDYTIKLTRQRKKNTMLCPHIPGFYGNTGKFSMSATTAEGHIFKKIINPNNLSYNDLINSWKGLKIFDGKEAIDNTPDVQYDNRHFSDESLLCALLNRLGPEGRKEITTNVTKDVDGIVYDWRGSTNRPDRTNWGAWKKEDLFAGKCLEANLKRPLWVYEKDNKPIVDYIEGYDDEK